MDFPDKTLDISATNRMGSFTCESNLSGLIIRHNASHSPLNMFIPISNQVDH